MNDKSQTELVKIALFSCQELIAALEELGWEYEFEYVNYFDFELRDKARKLGIAHETDGVSIYLYDDRGEFIRYLSIGADDLSMLIHMLKKTKDAIGRV